jgi:hypothetical protein
MEMVRVGERTWIGGTEIRGVAKVGIDVDAEDAAEKRWMVGEEEGEGVKQSEWCESEEYEE